MSSTPGRDSIDAITSPSTYSTASQYPFPHTGTPTKPSSSHKRNLRRGSTASSIRSVGGILDTGPSSGISVAETGRNAISTLLQAPIVRTGLLPHTAPIGGGYKPPTSRDIPPVTLTNIPHVDAKIFQPYLSQIGSLYDAFQRAKGDGDAANRLFHRDRTDSNTDEIEALLSPRSERPSLSRAGSSASNINTPPDSPGGKRSGSRQRRGHTVAPLSTIPKVYFEEDFHLENPRTFDIVSERSEVVRDPKQTNGTAPSGRKALATNAILQEKLSWYMDTVEIHLISSISTASKSFFSALGSLRELHSEAAESVKRIQRLRQDLSKLDKQMARGGLKIVNLKQRRENGRKLGDAMRQLHCIVESVKELEERVDNGDYEPAMDGLDGVERLISGQAQVPDGDAAGTHDLRGVKALDGVTSDLDYLRARIGKGYESRFLELLIGDLRHHVDVVSPKVTLERWGNTFSRTRGERKGLSEPPAFNNVAEDFRSNLRANLTGLARSRSTASAAAALKTILLKEMKALIRKHLPSSTDDDTESMVSTSTRGGKQLSQHEKSSILARNLRALDGEEAHKMFEKIYVGVSEALRRLSLQVKVVLDITSDIAIPATASGLRSPPRSPNMQSMDAMGRSKDGDRASSAYMSEDVQEILDLSSLLGEAVDIVQGQVIKVIKVRSEQTSKLSLAEFLRFFSLNRLFADECEAISGRTGMALKNMVDGQIKEFVSQFVEQQRQQMITVMDSDKWDAKDFGEKENRLLSKILEGSTKDDSSWSETTMIWLLNAGTAESNGLATNGNGTTPARDKIRGAIVDEQRYILAESALKVLSVIEKFQHLATGLPSLGQDTTIGLLDCLKIFNSRSSQLILGAGATRSAGLKNITTKHLALASQALSFIITLIPYLREFFRRHLLQNSSLLGEFDKVKRLYQEHQIGIHEKLVEIMGQRATVHVNAMKKIDWEDAAKNKSQTISPYVETLVKETGTLHKVLAKNLPEMTVTMIMNPVFASYREQFTKAFQEVSLRSESSKQRLLADAEFLRSRIDKIDGSDNLGQDLINIINGKPVIAPNKPKKESSPSPPVTKGDEDQSMEDQTQDNKTDVKDSQTPSQAADDVKRE
ncbi:putative garp complex component [Phaeomoniella chlamydospora]|uniref:Vacuolar protein sorting-associated protein 54 n=1 Tax=Phaeomoniella chlamydospora TaxID=158046 RepID=A0A0G2GAA1_PHACM|nr:putative garp complex component [Phaeomoniella chlamydospora]